MPRKVRPSRVETSLARTPANEGKTLQPPHGRCEKRGAGVRVRSLGAGTSTLRKLGNPAGAISRHPCAGKFLMIRKLRENVSRKNSTCTGLLFLIERTGCWICSREEIISSHSVYYRSSIGTLLASTYARVIE